MNKTISVTGKGKLCVKPDLVRLTLILSGVKESYADAVSDSAEKTATLAQAIEAQGFARADLKTTSFNVDTKYERYHDENGNYHQRLAGYEFVHHMYLELPIDNELLSATLYAISQCDCNPEISMTYTVKDTKVARDELLASAVSDAKHSAKIIAKAAKVELRDIVSINYSFSDVRIVSDFTARCFAGEADCAPNFDLQPDDIELSDNVTIIWSIA
ncbi:MAG: SIMPL domain-containing protein [Clostridia bacterium]|nr:SIMPL domain-containing protein [Clostridia bacterium]